MKLISVLSIITIIILTSCGSGEKKEKAQKIDELIGKVKNSREKLESVKVMEIKAIDSIFSLDIQNMSKAKIDFSKPEAMSAVEYMKLRRPFSNFLRDYSRTITQFDSLQSRLYDLKSRVKKDKIQPEAFNRSFTQNSAIYRELNERSRRLISSIADNQKQREQLRSRFLTLIEKK